MSFPAHIKYIVLSLLFVVATVNITRTTLKILESSQRLNSMRNEVLGLRERKVALEKDLAYKKTEEFIEEKARNELNMKKPGEDIFIAPENLKDLSADSPWTGTTTSTPKTNFQLWLDLFF